MIFLSTDGAHAAAQSVWLWLIRLGGPGLILLGIADNSFIPLTGGMDFLTIVLAAASPDWWWYYSVMATVGAVIGGYFTYKIGKKSGKEALTDRVPNKKLERIYKKFEKKGGFWAVFVPALLPPPVPFVPFLLAAGALQYPRNKFLVALSSGRLVRYSVLGLLAHIYGKQIIGFIAHYKKPVLISFLVLFSFGILSTLLLWWKKRKKGGAAGNVEQSPKAA